MLPRLFRPSMADHEMPLQNRVTPEGEIVAEPTRGLLMGNRGGALHDADRRLGRRRWVSRQWICCRLDFNGRRRRVMTPNRYTELFFLDEATALAAGHRPCFECRRQDFLWFATLWSRASAGNASRATAGEMDDILHLERLDGDARKRSYPAPLASLPSGSMVRYQAKPHLLLSGWLLPWSHQGYGPAIRADEHTVVSVLTPPSIVGVLAAGYCPMLHPTAQPG